MARARAKDLAGLAALGFLGYKLFGPKGEGKDGDSTSTRAARPESTETREEPRRKITDYIKKAPEDEKGSAQSNVLKAVTATKEAPNDKAGNQGVIPPKSSGKSAAAKQASEAAPAAKDEATVTPSSRKTPGGDEKRAEGRKPMPSLRAVESRAASNKTDAMRNASRANVAGANRQKAMAANPEAQAAERVYPEELLVGGPGVKVVGAAAKNLANRGAKEIPEYAIPRLGGPATQTTTAAPRLGGPTPQLTGPSKADLMARDRAARESARQEEMLRENARRSGLDPDNINPAVANKVRENMGGSDFSLGMKRGGMTKMASGGMTASRRGDGIASRGKTRGKIC
jgi:hypothetical protein